MAVEAEAGPGDAAVTTLRSSTQSLVAPSSLMCCQESPRLLCQEVADVDGQQCKVAIALLMRRPAASTIKLMPYKLYGKKLNQSLCNSARRLSWQSAS